MDNSMLIRSFDDLREIFREEARDAFWDLVDRRPGEQVCAFAVVTDDDADGIRGAGDTVTRRERRLAARKPGGRDNGSLHRWECSWQPDEWDDIYTEKMPNTRVPRMSAKDYFHAMLAFRREWTSVSGRTSHGFRRNALRSMVEALNSLNREGLFGTGQDRDLITVFVEISDSHDSDITKIATARELNPAIAARRLTGDLSLTRRLFTAAFGMTRWIVRGRLIAPYCAESN